MQSTNKIVIECCYPERYGYVVICMQLEANTNVQQALELLGLDSTDFIISIWSKRCQLDTVLKNNDRIELNYPLYKDPKTRLYGSN